MIRKLFLFAASVVFTASSFGQILDPVEWETSSRQISEDEYVLTFTANIEKGWYVYSQYLEDGGPIPTGFFYEEGDHFELIGDNEEEGEKKVEGHDEIFDMQLIKYAGVVTFSQKIKVRDISKPITGYLEYMTCDDEKCLAPTDEDFSFQLTSSDGFKKPEPEEVPRADPENSQEPEAADQDTIQEEASSAVMEVPSADFEINNDPIAECGEPLVTEKSNWGIFLLGFLGGLIALLTPCVFPMIPLTVSFFTKDEISRSKGLTNALLYGFFILLVYVLLSVPFHLIDNLNPDILNELSTNVYLNILFFVVFLVFAFSFFGYYEITLPSSWTNKSSQAEAAGGILGVFFMAITLALVSFSCTGPILGSLLAGALTSDGGAMQLTAGMSGFGLALALPFGLFAAFPGWMKNLPKSGGWMGNLKMALGFIELALAFKFLSNADLVQHWGVLKIEVFLGLWILIFLGMTIYFLKKFKWKSGFMSTHLKPHSGIVGVITLVAVIYLASGFRYNEETDTFTPLKLLSGLAPPVGYSFIYPNDCPQNLNCFKDLEAGVEYAKFQNKPIMLDFTGHACVNCRKMEEHVWPKKEVYDQLKNDVVLVSLYVDDREELPVDEQVVVERATGGKRKLRTIGQKWAHFQTENFNINSQPYYVLITPEGQVLNHPVAYTPEAAEYAEFLRCGIEAFSELNK